MITYINEHISVKGNRTSLLWIANYLMRNDISFSYDFMTKHLSFVQQCPEQRDCGELSPLQKIIAKCPHFGWDIVSQFQCSYSDILCK